MESERDVKIDVENMLDAEENKVSHVCIFKLYHSRNVWIFKMPITMKMCILHDPMENAIGRTGAYWRHMYSGPPLMRPPFGNGNCGRIRGVAAGEG